MKLEKNKSGILLKNYAELGAISLGDTLDCGQCFRFERLGDEHFSGVIEDIVLEVKKEGDDLFFIGASEDDFNNKIAPFFDFARDYKEIYGILAGDEILQKAMDYAGGIRVLRQEPFECIISFIISGNNNIKRIKGIIKTLAEEFGEKIDEHNYTFPTAEKLASLSIEELAPLRAGYRTPYILETARMIAAGEVSLKDIEKMPNEQAKAELIRLKGVGPKVADCALLFSYGRLDIIPMDVWMKRIMKALYPHGLPEELREYAGIAQQFLFHFGRHNPDMIK